MKDSQKIKREKRMTRARRVRAKIFGVPERPRLSVFRSNKHIYVQLIDDEKGKTLVGANDLELKKEKTTRIQKAQQVGHLIAKKAVEKNIKAAVFNKGGYKYHGLVKALADGAREEGLKF